MLMVVWTTMRIFWWQGLLWEHLAQKLWLLQCFFWCWSSVQMYYHRRGYSLGAGFGYINDIGFVEYDVIDGFWMPCDVSEGVFLYQDSTQNSRGANIFQTLPNFWRSSGPKIVTRSNYHCWE